MKIGDKVKVVSCVAKHPGCRTDGSCEVCVLGQVGEIKTINNEYLYSIGVRTEQGFNSFRPKELEVICEY